MSGTNFAALNGVFQELTAAGDTDVASDLIAEISSSPYLAAEITALSDNGVTFSMQGSGARTTNILPWASQHDQAVVAYGGSLTGADDPVTETGLLVGTIAAQAIVADYNPGSPKGLEYPSEQAALGTLLLNDARQDYSQMIVKLQDQGSLTPAAMSVPSIYFTDGGTVGQSTAALQAAARAGTVQLAEDSFAGSTLATTEGQADLRSVIANAAGLANPLGIDWSAVTSATAYTDPSGSLLAGVSVTTTTAEASTTYTTGYSLTVPAQYNTVAINLTATGQTLVLGAANDTTVTGAPARRCSGAPAT